MSTAGSFLFTMPIHLLTHMTVTLCLGVCNRQEEKEQRRWAKLHLLLLDEGKAAAYLL